MSYITTGERIGYERGKLEGEQALMILRQLQKRLGELSPRERRSSDWRPCQCPNLNP